MTEGVAVAIISALSLVLVTLITVLVPLAFSTRRHSRTAATQSAQANEQVSNDHKTNFRVEADERHEQNTQAIAEVKRAVVSQGRAHSRRFTRIEKRLGVVEDTIPTTRRRAK